GRREGKVAMECQSRRDFDLAVITRLNGPSSELERHARGALLQKRAQRSDITSDGHRLAAPHEAAVGLQGTGALTENDIDIKRGELLGRPRPVVGVMQAALAQTEAQRGQLL